MAGANPARYRGWAGSLGLGMSPGLRPSPRGCHRHRGAGTTLPPASQSPTLPPANRLQQPLPRGCLAHPGELPTAGNCSAKTLSCLVVKQEGGCSRCRNGEAAAVAAWNQRQPARLRHPVPTFPFFFFLYIFLLCPVLCQAAPSLAPSPSSWGLSVHPVLCPVPCSLLHGSAVPQASVSSSPQGLGHDPRAQMWDVLPPRTGKTAPLHPPQLLSLLRLFPSCRKCPESPGGDGCSALSLAAPKGQRWWPFLGQCPLFSSLPLPPPLPPKPPSSVPLCSKTRFSLHSCFPASSTLCYPPSTVRSLARHQPARGVTGQPRDPRPHPGPGTRMEKQKPRPRAAAARFASQVCSTST